MKKRRDNRFLLRRNRKQLNFDRVLVAYGTKRRTGGQHGVYEKRGSPVVGRKNAGRNSGRLVARGRIAGKNWEDPASSIQAVVVDPLNEKDFKKEKSR